MKNVNIAGGLGKDAELRTTQSGDKVASFSVAVDHRQGSEKSTVWFDCSLFGKRAEALSQYLTKGTRVAVSGDLGTREYNGKTYLTVKADQVTLLGGGQGGQSSGGSDPARQAPARDDLDRDTIPF
jgi:single-strand DNA-binding protein